jgi:hypothetical protein
MSDAKLQTGFNAFESALINGACAISKLYHSYYLAYIAVVQVCKSCGLKAPKKFDLPIYSIVEITSKLVTVTFLSRNCHFPFCQDPIIVARLAESIPTHPDCLSHYTVISLGQDGSFIATPFSIVFKVFIFSL